MMARMQRHVSAHHSHMQGAARSHTPGTSLVATDPRGAVGDCWLTFLPPLRLLSALVTFVLMVRIP
jgi:hypothetical protein